MQHATPRGRGSRIALALATFLAVGALALLLIDRDAPPAAEPTLGDAETRAPRDAAAPERRADAAPTDAAPTDEAAPAQAAEGEAAPAPAPAAPARTRGRNEPLPLTSAGRVDFAALGLTGKESGAELLRSEEPEQRAPVRYAFEVGQSWEVETYYRQMQAGDGDVWSDPVRWRFEVEAEDAFEGAACKRIVVRMLDAAGQPDGRFPPTSFYVGADQRLLGADLYEVRGGKGKYHRVAYDRADGAQRARGSIVPFELPPNGVAASLRAGPDLPDLEPATPGSRARFPQPGELVGAGAESLVVSFTLPDGAHVTQRWAPGDLRWPVESIGPHRRSYRRK